MSYTDHDELLELKAAFTTAADLPGLTQVNSHIINKTIQAYKDEIAELKQANDFLTRRWSKEAVSP